MAVPCFLLWPPGGTQLLSAAFLDNLAGLTELASRTLLVPALVPVSMP